MNIAIFVPILDQIGGAELATWQLAERLAARDHSVTIITTQAISQWQQRRSVLDYAKGIRIIRLPAWQRSIDIFRRMLTAQALWAFPLFLRETQIIHLRGLTPETMTLARIARKMRMATLCVPMASGIYGDAATFSSNVSRDNTVFDWLSGLTDALRNEAITWGMPADKTGIIPNGVDIDFFKPPQYQNNESHVIFVGQFRPEKQVGLLLQAWAHIQIDYPHTRLTLVGGGKSSEHYAQMAAQLGISPVFIPNTDAAGVLTNLQENSIFVMSGISEGMSNALLEAMAVGLAPIIADTPANRAVITPEFNGLSYQPDSPEALAAQIKRLLADADLRSRMGAVARKTVVQQFNLEAVTEQYLALYTQLLGE